MGNCCSVKKPKKRSGNDDYDGDEDSLKILHPHEINVQHKNRSNATFDTDTVKQALVDHKATTDIDADGVGLGAGPTTTVASTGTTSTSKQTQPQPQPPHPSSAPPAVHPAETKKATGDIEQPNFKVPMSAIPRHLRLEGFHRKKHNSTSSLYINSSLSTPDNDELLRCMAQALLYHIERGHMSPHKTYFEIFSEEKFPITKGFVDTRHIPDVEAVYKFLHTIFKAERLDSECAIMCLAYIERIITLTGVSMDSTNWRRIVLSALILASKVWEDQSVWNVDFLPVFDNLTATDLNKLERQFLALLQYNVSLNASLYAKYYFELRGFSDLDEQHFPLQPLDKLGVKRLEDHSQASEKRVRTVKRSASLDQLNPVEHHTPAVLN